MMKWLILLLILLALATPVVIAIRWRRRIRKLEEARRDFVANVSHELRTPLSVIKGYVETMLDSMPNVEGGSPSTAREARAIPAETQREFLQTIQKHTTRLEALVNDLLDISALESQQAKLSFESVSLRAVAGAVTGELTLRASQKGILIALEIPFNFPSVRADEQRLHQVITNLLDNAVKYTPAGGRVTMSARENGAEIEVCVADNGAGIPPEHLPHIFERFYRVDKTRSREQGGTGLGLSIVKHIVQVHGGRVWAESAMGEGSKFFFMLPRG